MSHGVKGRQQQRLGALGGNDIYRQDVLLSLQPSVSKVALDTQN